MATPLGHFLAGATVGALCGGERRTGRPVLAGGLVAMAPDLDFIPGLLLGEPARYHHAVTHTLLFALLAGMVAALAAPRARWRWTVLVGGAYSSHLLLDFLTHDPSPPRGIPLFWPVISDALHSPIFVFPQVLHTIVCPVNLHNFTVMLLEIALLGPLLAAAALRARGRGRTPALEDSSTGRAGVR